MLNALPKNFVASVLASSTLAVGLAIISEVTAEPVRAASIFSVSGFEGPYTPANFTLSNDNADGFVDITDAPNSITLTGGDNGSGFFGSTSFTTSAPADGTVLFDYDYDSFNRDGPFFDPFGILVNDTFTQISDDFGPDNQVGSFSFDINQGDTFGFAVQTVDNILGPASVTISNFEAPAVSTPEPGTILGILAVGCLSLRLKLKKYS